MEAREVVGIEVRSKAQSPAQMVIDQEQRDLIKRTCMPRDSSEDELALFLHVAAKSGLDPMRRHIHCTKLAGRLAFIADINGLQARAAQEADFEGITHAVVYEKDNFEVDEARGEVLKHTHNPLAPNGKILGAWAIVRRRGMLPFLSVVRYSEYENANNPLWRSKGAVMIDKCAKSTALRIAYPTQLGGIYEQAELDQAKGSAKEINPPMSRVDEVRRDLQLEPVEAHEEETGEVIEVTPAEDKPPKLPLTGNALSNQIDDTRSRLEGCKVGTPMHKALAKRLLELERQIDAVPA